MSSSLEAPVPEAQVGSATEVQVSLAPEALGPGRFGYGGPFELSNGGSNSGGHREFGSGGFRKIPLRRLQVSSAPEVPCPGVFSCRGSNSGGHGDKRTLLQQKMLTQKYL